MDSVKWEPITSADPAQYLSISADPQMRHSYNYDCVAFWKQLIPDIERLDLVRPKPKESGTQEKAEEEEEEVWEHDEL